MLKDEEWVQQKFPSYLSKISRGSVVWGIARYFLEGEFLHVAIQQLKIRYSA
jgi:hypothetical protein